VESLFKGRNPADKRDNRDSPLESAESEAIIEIAATPLVKFDWQYSLTRILLTVKNPGPEDLNHFDNKNKLVTTPSYMLGPRIKDVAKGIQKLVDKVLELATAQW